MYLNALTKGCAFPQEDFEAVVQSVFQPAVNLRPTRSKLLLTLSTSGEADLPQGVRVNSPADFSFDQKLRIGEKASCQGKLLFFQDSSLVIDLNSASRWECDLPALRGNINNPTTAAAWDFAWQILNERQARLGAELQAAAVLKLEDDTRNETTKRAGKAILALGIGAIQHWMSDYSFQAGVVGVVGLGPGLTPAGDDLLVGFLAGLWCTLRGREDCAKFLTRLGRAIIRASKKTNDLSRTYIFQAARGQVSSRVEALARAICSGEGEEQIRTAAEAAMQSGHSSGMDTVTGLLLGLRAWER
ncbi:MAG TPA: DUF2877 domain-containing protein [Anaerolineales bacterium]